jgi:hypothetical protein
MSLRKPFRSVHQVVGRSAAETSFVMGFCSNGEGEFNASLHQCALCSVGCGFAAAGTAGPAGGGFGTVRAARRGRSVPVYRLSATTTLPGLGSVRSIWRPALAPLLAELAEPAHRELLCAAAGRAGPPPCSASSRSGSVTMARHDQTRDGGRHSDEVDPSKVVRPKVDDDGVTTASSRVVVGGGCSPAPKVAG